MDVIKKVNAKRATGTQTSPPSQIRSVVHYFMKAAIFITALLFGRAATGQFQISSTVRNDFENFLKIQPKYIQKLRNSEIFENGFTLLSTLREDTLNIQDFTPSLFDTSSEKSAVDPLTGQKLISRPKEAIKYDQGFSCEATYLKDTLRISSFFGFLSVHGFSIKIFGDKCDAHFFEYALNDSIYRRKLTDPKTSYIVVKARTEKVVLSKMPKKESDILYGKAILLTEPFYEDNNNFKNGYIYTRYFISFLFTCKLTPEKK